MPQSLSSPAIVAAETLAQAIARAQRLRFDAQITIIQGNHPGGREQALP
jgi:hypothetical protein